MGFFDFLNQAKETVTDMASQAGLGDVAGQASDAAAQASDAASNVANDAAEQIQGATEDAGQKAEDAKDIFNQE